jgi:transposase
MKDYKHFYGVDVSKQSIDIAYSDKQTIVHRKFENNSEGMDQLMIWLDDNKTNLSSTLFCMETTGLYCLTLTHFLSSHSVDVWIEHSAAIKKATALARGKNDKVDSIRIVSYAIKNQDRLRLWRPMDSTLTKLKHLATLRERLVDTIKRLTVPVQEFVERGDLSTAKLLTMSMKKTLTALDKDLELVESQIMKVINDDENLKKLYKIITSVVGIGFVTAVNLMIHTQGFSVLNDARKLACYCGVAPFEYSSGTSIKGKTKVHHMANKKLKCNLHMASLTAVKYDLDLKKYYERKVASGKNKLSVLNAVKSKLLARVVSCVNNKKLYVKTAA